VDWLCGVVGTRGSGCQTRCASASRVQPTATAVCATTCAIGRRKSASTAGTAPRARPSATAASGTRTASASGRRRQSTDRSTSSAANASERCDPPSLRVQSRRSAGTLHRTSPTYRRDFLKENLLTLSDRSHVHHLETIGYSNQFAASPLRGAFA